MKVRDGTVVDAGDRSQLASEARNTMSKNQVARVGATYFDDATSGSLSALYADLFAAQAPLTDEQMLAEIA